MSKRLILAGLPLLLVSFITLKSTAQTDLSGNWGFQSQTSISGTLYVNGSPTQLKIKQDGNRLIIAATVSNGTSDLVLMDTLNLEGKPYVTQTAKHRKKVIIVKRSEDGKGYMEEENIYSLTEAGKLDFKQTDIWTIEDGNLVLDRKNENFTNGETWESKATYSKQ